MIAFVGLGNPGDKYANTKHNTGFWILDEMAKRHKISFKAGKGDYVLAIKPNKFLLFKPTTGMNKSGYAVQDISNVWNLIPKDICVIIDDVIDVAVILPTTISGVPDNPVAVPVNGPVNPPAIMVLLELIFPEAVI